MSGFSTAFSGVKLDFRFADDGDIEDLELFIRSCLVPLEGDFRHPDYPTVVTSKELEEDMDGMGVRWLVLETPVPEEALVAAARLRRDPDRTGRIDVLCAADTADLREHALRRLLLIAETVSFNLDLRTIAVQVPEWRHDLCRLLASLGYRQLSGCAWPQDKLHQLIKPTMLLDYHKMLLSTTVTAQSANELTTRCGLTISTADVDHVYHPSLDDEVASAAAAQPSDEMERLMESLFMALRVEYPDPDPDLSTEDVAVGSSD